MDYLSDIPLKVLIIDPNESSSTILAQTLNNMSQTVLNVQKITSYVKAKNILSKSDFNTIFIDPLSFSLDKASKFIFDVRKRYPTIVYVLYLNLSAMERSPSGFFGGEPYRFQQYFRLDKLTPIASFPDEVKTIVRACQGDLSYSLTEEKITKLQKELENIRVSTETESVELPLSILKDIQKQLDELKTHQSKETRNVKSKTVFLSYRFAEKDYVDGLTTLLERDEYEIITGLSANTYISQAIIERIRSCEFFLCLMTRSDEKSDGTFTTSPWLLEEKGAALALGKRIVLMVEDGVNDVGGLQGDWQQIRFTAKSFTSAAIQAVDQLKSYSGESAT